MRGNAMLDLACDFDRELDKGQVRWWESINLKD